MGGAGGTPGPVIAPYVAPESAAEVLKLVSQTATFIGSWYDAVTAIRDAASIGGTSHSLLAAIDAANGLAQQWCPEAAVRTMMIDSQKVMTLVGPQSWSMANALGAADRAWPHAHAPWHGGTGSSWPAAAQDVLEIANRVLAALQEAAEHAAALLLIGRSQQSRIGQRVDVQAAVAEWNLPPCSAAQVIAWIGPDPRLDGKRVPLTTDIATGSLYRTPKSKWERLYTTTAGLWGSTVGLALIILAFVLLHSAHLFVWPEYWLPRLIVLYLCVVAGALLHVASSSLSSIQFGDPLKIYAAATGVDWLGLRWLSILRILVPVVIVAGSLWGAGNIADRFQDLGVAVLSGYSADSLFRNSISRLGSNPGEH
jgi:hypothetical protein